MAVSGWQTHPPAAKPMQVRKAVFPSVLKLGRVMSAVGAPEKATHEQRATAIRELLKIANNKERDDGVDRVVTYGDDHWVRNQCYRWVWLFG
jgi:hypothetical protein